MTPKRDDRMLSTLYARKAVVTTAENVAIKIYGVVYKIKFKNYGDDPIFQIKNVHSYCDGHKKIIAICKAITIPGYENNSVDDLVQLSKSLLREEIINAIKYESKSAEPVDGPEGGPYSKEVLDYLVEQSSVAYSTLNVLGLA